jgi:hypothetical protein
VPHAFKAHPGHPAVDYLVRLHADLGGQIQNNKAEAMRLAEAMKHVEAVIKLFDPDYSVRAISVRRRQKTNPWFKRGTLFREALTLLRTATQPLTVKQITDGLLARKGIKDATKRQWHGIESGIRVCLDLHAGKAVVRVGEGIPSRWAVKS